MELSNNLNAGVALIKKEYLVQNHVRELSLEFVASKDKKRVSEEDSAADSYEPKKKKLKGQNKHRPRSQKTAKSDKLCFKIGTDGVCPFGDSCCYSHDVDTYLSKKLPDIGTTCYLYRTFGKCPYSFSCRFASDHIKDGKNIILENIWENYKDKNLFVSILTKKLQISLRRRDYNFEKSETVLKNFTGTVNKNKFNRHDLTTVSEEILQRVSTMPKSDVASVKVENSEEIKTSGLDGSNKPTLHAAQDSSIQGVPDILCQVKEEHSVTPDASESVETYLEEIKKENLSSDNSNSKAIKMESLDITNFEPKIKKMNFKDKLYLAPLTTVGNLPFRRICKEFGADITCSEMAVALSLLQGQQSEWALIRRHHTEDIFGIQLCGNQPNIMTRCCQVLSETASFDFIDLNLGCPLDAVYKNGAGCGLMNRLKKLEGIVYGVSSVINVPLTLKMRKGIYGHEDLAHNLIEKVKQWNNSISLITLHGRSREQRYTKSADWNYIDTCNKVADPVPLFGNGDILSYEDYNMRRAESDVAGVMIARGALIKPWIFKEIKDQAHWDISSQERLDILRNFSNYGLEHWGSDTEGIEKTRRFLLEWLSFLYRYIPVGLLERLPQRINERPPPYFGRNDLETMMSSPSCSDWVKISEMLLGPVPDSFIFLPKHKANAYK